MRPTHKVGFLGLWGERVDSLEHWENAVKEANEKILELKVRLSIVRGGLWGFNSVLI